jgi:hypothetical protein
LHPVRFFLRLASPPPVYARAERGTAAGSTRLARARVPAGAACAWGAMHDDHDLSDPSTILANEIVRAAFYEAFEPPRLTLPGPGHVGVREVLATYLALDDGSVIEGTAFQTNIPAHLRILEEDVFRRHSLGDDRGRHVNWVVQAFRRSGGSVSVVEP